MSILAQAKMYWRLATGLRGFLKEPITLEQASSIIKDRLANRERNFLIYDMGRRVEYLSLHASYVNNPLVASLLG